MRYRTLMPCLLFLILSFGLSYASSVYSGQVAIMDVKGAIGPAISDFIQHGLETSAENDATLVIIRIDTPGGLDLSMRDIIQAILHSSIPVVTYVAPDGARAASAGTYILYASHVAAMAPATNLGAATPVTIGTLPTTPNPPKSPKQSTPKITPSSTMERKMINDASAYIRALADRHKRNAEWADQAVRESVSLSAKEALDIGVIDVVATDIPDLLAQIDGRQVHMESGLMKLVTKDMEIITIEQTWHTQLLSVISDPNVAYILFLLGLYGLIYELANPGFFLPGVVGSIAILLALYAFQILPINYTGLALIVLGIMLLVGETFVPSFGTLGIGGVIAFVIGSLILVRDDEIRIALPVILGTVITLTTFIFLLMGRVLTMRKKQVITGIEAIIGSSGEVIDDFDEEGRIWISGESWQARCSSNLKQGEVVTVTAKDGLWLIVEKTEEER